MTKHSRSIRSSILKSEQRISRRDVMHRGLTTVSTLLAGSASFPRRVGAGTRDAESRNARKRAAWRKRPLILDDDGDLVYADETLKGSAEFLALRMHDCRDAGVKSLAWCIMWAIAQKGKTATRYWQTQLMGVPFQENMPDPTPVIEKFCKEHEIEVFGSIRMNDSHDAYGLPFKKLVYPLKVKHPEVLIGDPGQKGTVTDGMAAAMWSGLDFSHERVRQDRLRWVRHAAGTYELDGVDLNFFRMPWYFKLGEEQKNMHLMTDLIRKSRQMLDEIGEQRGWPVLLGVRVPGTVETCNRIGLDIETWLREHLVDRVLTGGGYVCYSTPAEELVKLGHRYEVPVYPCINCPMSFQSGNGNLRAAAANFWSAGADGIYLWNFQYIDDPQKFGYGRPSHESYQRHLAEISDPQKLKYLDKSFAVNARVWEQYQRASAPAPLPLTLGEVAGVPAKAMPVRIADDVSTAFARGKLRDVMLRLKVQGSVSGDALALDFNGARSEFTVTDTTKWSSHPISPPAVRQGVNQIHLGIARRGQLANVPLTVEQARVDLRYV
ncbi:MAG: hypothetical protein CMJ81_03580 [Planctomycetaceae bacterium]|nr:hypothetical protein [Planctomycetaceae bacterium]MBP62998.1 hypothetical protein [Planctomycetaceae bacterium]